MDEKCEEMAVEPTKPLDETTHYKGIDWWPSDKPYLIGDVLEQLALLPDKSVQCVVTSPPYWGLRNYGVDGQLGLEKTPEEYVEHMVAVFHEIKRVLRIDGTCYLNLGDSYAGGAGRWGGTDPKNMTGFQSANKGSLGQGKSIPWKHPIIKPKDLVGIPWRVALALQADGWWLRSDIIWDKPNTMPESCTDRPTKAHEYIFLLTKSAKYYYDHEAIKEPYTEPMNRWDGDKLVAKGQSSWDSGTGQTTYRDRNMRPDPSGRNARSVWHIATKPFKGAHFATFPPEIPERCIKAGTKPGDIVLDPFAGSGTTMYVAEQLGRIGLGIDLNPNVGEHYRNRLVGKDVSGVSDIFDFEEETEE